MAAWSEPGLRIRLALMVALIVVPLITSPAGQAAERVDRARFVPLRVVILKVEARLDDGRLHIGTGVTVAPGVVLTNCHVVEHAEAITVSKRAGRWPVVAQHAIGRHDLCFLKVPGWRGSPIEFGEDRRPVLHEVAASVGYTGGAELSFTEGEITGVHAFDNAWLLQTTSAFTSGASGGALLDSQARLLGILTFRLPGRDGHYYAVPAAWVRQDMPVETDWQPVGTPIAERPFWQGERESLPYFMQVPSLEAQAGWQQLMDLADQWQRSAPESAEPLWVRGRALARLERRDEAIVSLQAATRIDQRFLRAWVDLGSMLRTAGRDDEFRQVLLTLQDLDADLARELETGKGMPR